MGATRGGGVFPPLRVAARLFSAACQRARLVRALLPVPLPASTPPLWALPSRGAVLLTPLAFWRGFVSASVFCGSRVPDVVPSKSNSIFPAAEGVGKNSGAPVCHADYSAEPAARQGRDKCLRQP